MSSSRQRSYSAINPFFVTVLNCWLFCVADISSLTSSIASMQPFVPESHAQDGGSPPIIGLITPQSSWSDSSCASSIEKFPDPGCSHTVELLYPSRVQYIKASVPVPV